MPPGIGRRRILQAAAAGATLASLPVLARDAVARQDRPATAFAGSSLAAVLQALYGKRPLTDSPRVILTIVDTAEDGAIVPVQVQADVPDARTLALFADRNPVPLLTLFHLTPALGTRIKLAESGTVLAVVDTGSELLVGRRTVRVTRGGCA